MIPSSTRSCRHAVQAALVLLFAVAGVAWLAGPAHAHAVLQSTVPADGSVVEEVPAEVTLQFNEPVEAALGSVRVVDQSGERVDAGDAGSVAEDPSQLRVGLPADLPDGTYVTSFAAVSADGHPVQGAFVFHVGTAAPADTEAVEAIYAAAATPDETGLTAAASILRAVLYGGTLVAIGGVVFLLGVHDRNEAERWPLTRVALVGAAIAAAATLLGLAVQGALLSGLGPAALLEPPVLAGALGTSYGLSAGVRLGGLAVLLMALPWLWRRAAVVAAGAGAAAVLTSFVLTGHTLTTEPRWLVIGADLSHLLAAAAWGGGLVLLFVALRRRRAADDPVGGGRMVARFSGLATGAVLLVALAGMGLAWAQVRAPRALVGTTYGWTLIGKVTVVAAILAIGAYNRRRLVPAIASGSHDAWSRLRRTVRYEVLGLMAVVAITGWLVNLPPARVQAGVEGVFSEYTDLGEDYQLNMTVDPNRAGSNEVHLYLLGRDGRPADAARDLTLGFSLPASDIGPIERTPQVAGPGHWLHTGPELSIPGQWTVEVTARVSDFEQLSTEISFNVNP